jgi:hypothetical protein
MLLFTACPFEESRYLNEIKFINNSQDTIVINGPKLDTMMTLNGYTPEIIDAYIIAPTHFLLFPFPDEHNGQIYHYFFLDKEVVDTVPWDTIRSKYLILKRYDVSFDDMEKMNWTITYP